MISAASHHQDSSENPAGIVDAVPALRAAPSAWWHHAGRGRASQELPSDACLIRRVWILSYLIS